MFAGDSDAQIVHTVHPSGKPATATTASEYLHRRNVLDDLDVRASDLLQSNGIIWVEGPSDRTYINHWISLASGGTLREGTHYQCVLYGGKLLAHFSGDPPEEVAKLVSIFRVNRNAAIVIDSDRSQESDAINATKERISHEIEAMDGFAWVTAGREIENYLPSGAIAHVEAIEGIQSLGRFQDFADYLEAAREGAGKRFERTKAEFAARATEAIDLDSQSKMLDWTARIRELCGHVRRWNQVPAPGPERPVAEASAARTQSV
jgi:putative ATP-dependent endonuclease of OLD family